jgi:hypothetical protein
MIRKAKAVWRGTGRAGNGNLSTDSGVLANTPYSFRTRFENDKGTQACPRQVGREREPVMSGSDDDSIEFCHSIHPVR